MNNNHPENQIFAYYCYLEFTFKTFKLWKMKTTLFYDF